MKAIIILVLLCSLPLLATAQTDKTEKATVALSKPILKGLYFGVQVAPFVGSSLKHKIPYDTAKKMFVSENSSEYTKIIANQPVIYFNAKVVVCKWLTIDFCNLFRSVKGTVNFSEYRGSGGNVSFFGPSSYIVPKETYSLNFINNNFTINPNFTIDIENTKLFFGIGYGKSTNMSRTGSLDRKYNFRRSSDLYQINIGYSAAFKKGIVSCGITSGWSSEMALGNWNAYQRYTLLSIGYVLPLFTLKHKLDNPPAL